MGGNGPRREVCASLAHQLVILVDGESGVQRYYQSAVRDRDTLRLGAELLGRASECLQADSSTVRRVSSQPTLYVLPESDANCTTWLEVRLAPSTTVPTPAETSQLRTLPSKLPVVRVVPLPSDVTPSAVMLLL